MIVEEVGDLEFKLCRYRAALGDEQKAEFFKRTARGDLDEFCNIDVHFGVKADDVQRPDEEGDWILSGTGRDRRNSHQGEVRVQIVKGTTWEGSRRALRKILKWVEERNPWLPFFWHEIRRREVRRQGAEPPEDQVKE